MRCLICESLSLTHICIDCQNTFLSPSLYKRNISNNIEVISFYKYSDIKDLLHTKHTDLGYYIYSLLAKNSIKKFASSFSYHKTAVSIAIDDYAQEGYSHTAILNKALKSEYITPIHGKLRSKNRVSYSGKSKQYRLMHPRCFELKAFKEDDVILVDDIITTGSTLTQAADIIKRNNKRLLFCLTLADANLK